jgi:iron complex outermembrane receptor protein
VTYARSGEAFGDLYTPAHRVLRGPQGTLFGKNASAGVINVVTRRPGDTSSAAISRPPRTTDEEIQVRGAVDSPDGEGIAGRFTANYWPFERHRAQHHANRRSTAMSVGACAG